MSQNQHQTVPGSKNNQGRQQHQRYNPIGFRAYLVQVLAEMDAFCTKLSVFGSDYLGPEYQLLQTRQASCQQQLLHMKLQYIESALAFALLFLSQPDQGTSAGKDPKVLKMIVSEQFTTVASTEGLDEGMIQNQLLEAAKPLRN